MILANLRGISYGTGSYNPVPGSFTISSATINLYNIQGGLSSLYVSFANMNVTWTAGAVSTLIGTTTNNKFEASLTYNLVSGDMPTYPITLSNNFHSYLTNSVYISVLPTVPNGNTFYIWAF